MIKSRTIILLNKESKLRNRGLDFFQADFSKSAAVIATTAKPPRRSAPDTTQHPQLYLDLWNGDGLFDCCHFLRFLCS